MAATQVGIVYSIARRSLRAVVAFDEDAQISRIRPIQGTKIILQGKGAYRLNGAHAVVASDSHGPPLTNRCAVIIGGLVTTHIMADLAIDTVADATLVYSDKSREGDAYISDKIMRRYVRFDKDRIVTEVVMRDIEQPTNFNQYQENETANIGDVLPLPEPAPEIPA